MLSETIDQLSISHIPMTHLTHLRIFLEQAQVYIYIENLTRKWTKSGTFYSQNQDTIFEFQKRAGEASPAPPPSPSCAPDMRCKQDMHC